MADKVFPPRNLPGLADNWGREVQNETLALRREILSTNQNIGNLSRSTGGQLAVISVQLDTIANQQAAINTQQSAIVAQQAEIASQQAELVARSSVTQSLSNLSVSASAPPSTPGSVNWESGDRNFTPPRPTGGARYVDLSVSGGITGSNTGGSQPTAHLMLLRGSTPIASEMVNVPTSTAAGYPPNWNTRFRLDADMLLAASGSTFTLRLYVGAYYAGGTTTISLSGLTATTRYGQRG